MPGGSREFPRSLRVTRHVAVRTWRDAPVGEVDCATKDYYDATAPHSEEGGYVNFAAEDDQDRVRASFGANYDRSVEVKRRYDPDNLFRHNQNIKPD